MSAILNSLNAQNLPIFQPILMILVSKFMVHRALSDITYLLIGLLSPLRTELFGHYRQYNRTNTYLKIISWKIRSFECFIHQLF